MDSDGKKLTGIYRATVYSNSDPNNQRRLRLLIPAVLGPAEPTGWVWPADMSTAYPTPPAVGQGVWVMFEQGMPNNPLWIGTFGKYKGKGSQVELTELPPGDYVATISDNISGQKFDLIAAIVDIANKVDEIRIALNEYEGGLADAPPDIGEN
jgi:hypothetical protein